MGLIKSLPEKLISKIAAGEVVDRPASIVKELIENSLDAGASYIKVEIEQAGTKRIQVTDNGCGMIEEDILNCFKPHTTSKLFHEDDLFALSSMGFRGEALSSISAVSNVVIKSRIVSEVAGNIVEIDGGDILRHTSIGMPVGTSILVRNLFSKIPARRKFLKSIRTEFRHILDVVISMALSHPEIGFFLSHDKRIILDLPEQQSVSDRVRVLLGKDVYENLIPISHETEYHKVSGFVTKPQISTKSRSKQHLFVNKRAISNELVSSAVKDAYGSLLMPREHPVFVLFFDTPPSLVDVNIHPRKEEVAFSSESAVYDLFKSSIENIFEKEDLKYTFDDYIDDAVDYDFHDVVADLLHEEEDSFYDTEEILQVQRLYLIKQTDKGVLLIDQHAAHERIIYEQLLEKLNKKDENYIKEFSSPLLIDLSLSEIEVLKEYMGIFNEIGIDIEEFGDNTFKISKAPFYVDEKSALVLMKEVLEDLLQGKSPKSLDARTERTISYIACRSAIKAGDFLSQQERKELFDELERTKTIYTCPHGRPVKMELTMNELARMFKRK